VRGRVLQFLIHAEVRREEIKRSARSRVIAPFSTVNSVLAKLSATDKIAKS